MICSSANWRTISTMASCSSVISRYAAVSTAMAPARCGRTWKRAEAARKRFREAKDIPPAGGRSGPAGEPAPQPIQRPRHPHRQRQRVIPAEVGVSGAAAGAEDRDRRTRLSGPQAAQGIAQLGVLPAVVDAGAGGEVGGASLEQPVAPDGGQRRSGL